jgi:hypothetical protein
MNADMASGYSVTEDEVTLTFYLIGDKKSATDEVWARISSYVKSKGLNVRFLVKFIPVTDYKNEMLVMAASGSKWDMNFDTDWQSYREMAANGAYMPLNDLLPTYAPHLYDKYKDLNVLQATEVNGEIYRLALDDRDEPAPLRAMAFGSNEEGRHRSGAEFNPDDRGSRRLPAPTKASLSERQPEPGYREDVITFLSAPLQNDLKIAGRIIVSLNASSSAEDTAFTVKVIEVFPDGDAYNIADGITSLAYRNGATEQTNYEPHRVERLEIELWPIAWRIRKGSRIRLDVSSSNFPAYHIHPNSAGNWSRQETMRKATQTLYWGGKIDSRIEFPIH